MASCEVNVIAEVNLESSDQLKREKVLENSAPEIGQQVKNAEAGVTMDSEDQEPLKNVVNITPPQLDSLDTVKVTPVGESGVDNENRDGCEENKENITEKQTETLTEPEKFAEDEFSEVILEPPVNAEGSEGFQGFAVTPVGASTSYKGMTTSEILENSKNKKTEEPPKTRKKKPCNSKGSTDRARSSKQSNMGINDTAGDKGSFTRKLQQFLSGSISLFSPHGKGQKDGTNIESTEQKSELSVPSSSTNKSLNFAKAAIELQNSSSITVTESEINEGPENMNSADGQFSSLNDNDGKIESNELEISIKKETCDMNEESITTDAGTELERSETSTNVKSKSTFTSLREMIRDIGSPRSSKYSINRRGQTTSKNFNNFNSGNTTNKKDTEAAIEDENVTGISSNETVENKNGLKLYSREKLLELSEQPACQHKPKITEVIEVSVAEDIDLGTEVPKKYSPVRILSREFKLKYRL